MARFNVSLDESCLPNVGLMVVSAYVSLFANTARFDEKWAAMLRKYGVRYLHMVELQNGRSKVYAKLGKFKKESLLRCAAQIMKDHMLFSVTTAVFSGEYRKKTNKEFRREHGTEYGICFQAALAATLKRVGEYPIEDENGWHTVDIHVEEGPYFGEAKTIMGDMHALLAPTCLPERSRIDLRKDHVKQLPVVIRAYGKGSKDGERAHFSLQAADILAYCAVRQAQRKESLIIAEIMQDIAKAIPQYGLLLSDERLDLLIQTAHAEAERREVEREQVAQLQQFLWDYGFQIKKQPNGFLIDWDNPITRAFNPFLKPHPEDKIEEIDQI